MNFALTVTLPTGTVATTEVEAPAFLPAGEYQGMIHTPEGDHPCKIITRPTYLRAAVHADYCTATLAQAFACTCA